jgi:hypothetical protein
MLSKRKHEDLAYCVPVAWKVPGKWLLIGSISRWSGVRILLKTAAVGRGSEFRPDDIVITTPPKCGTS